MRSQTIISLLSLALSFPPSPFCRAQSLEQSERPVSNKDRANRLAELVSLSPAAIIQILQREPGLLLEVKKALVRRAYEQGRLLEAEDLTDEALFQLLHEDASARALATREVEARMYVRAKPNSDELRQTQDWAIVEKGSFQADPQPANGSQEAQFWATHEQIPLHQPEDDADVTEEHEQSAGHVVSRQPPPLLQEVRVGPGLASVQTNSGGWFLPPDAGPSPRVSAITVPGLVNADMSDRAVRMTGAEAEKNPVQPNLPLQMLNQAPIVESAPLSDSSSMTKTSARPTTWLRPTTAADVRGHEVDRSGVEFRREPNPYQDVPSLYDLYRHAANRGPTPQRFGLEIFQNGTGNTDQLPMDLPVGPDYILGPGDGLKIEVWGSASGHLERVVDRQGLLSLPDAGTISVAGKSLGEVQGVVQGALRTQYRNAQADLSIARVRTVRVYVVGDVNRPGAYDVSALSTPLNALYLAGGPTLRGSMRLLRHYRGPELLETIDLYDLLLKGVRKAGWLLQPGDTLLVPPLGKEVTVEGMVRRPAVYELNGESKLAEVLEIAGGILSAGTLRHVEVERIIAHENRTMLQLDLPEKDQSEGPSHILLVRARKSINT